MGLKALCKYNAGCFFVERPAKSGALFNEYTQYAYQLDDVSTKAFAADNTLTAADIAENSETISNIRINDLDPAKQFYNQTQSIRQYYTFNDVDNDRYMIDGKYTQTYLATREIDETKISDSWLNRHLS